LATLARQDWPACEFYLLHTVLDIGGSGGHRTLAGSPVLDESLYKILRAALKALARLRSGSSPVPAAVLEVYDDYVTRRAGLLQMAVQLVEALRSFDCLFVCL
jgi:hypothetical protein